MFVVTNAYHVTCPSRYIGRIEISVKQSAEDVEAGRPAPEPTIFPLNRWIHAGTCHTVLEYDSFLPQADPNKEQRARELRAKREDYVLSGKILGAPPQVSNRLNKHFIRTKIENFELITALVKLLLHLCIKFQ